MELEEQIRELTARVAFLEAALDAWAAAEGSAGTEADPSSEYANTRRLRRQSGEMIRL